MRRPPPEPALSSRRAPHPFFYSLLISPFGIVSGFNTVALVHIATTPEHGFSEVQAASLVAVGMIPHTWKVLWAPVADTTLTRKRWYIIATTLCALGVFAMGAVPLTVENIGLLNAIIFVTNIATTFVGMAVEGMMAHLTTENQRGNVSGWFQAGNLGGGGIGGGLGLWMALHLPAEWMAGAVLGGLFLACIAALRLFDDVPAESRDAGLLAAMWGAVRDLFRTALSTRAGLLCSILCFLPIGTGAASGVLAQASVAGHWGAGEAEVELVNGLMSGTIAAIGCLVGGSFSSRWPPRSVYAAVGALMALTTLAMAAAPAVPMTFIVGGLIYSFVTGLAYAAFTAFVLDAIGAGAAATKYNAFAALSNIPILYMGLVLAKAADLYGAPGMLQTESLFGVVGIGILGLAAFGLRKMK